MKKVIWIMFALMVLGICGLEAVYAKPLRLHILANSDAPEDQQVKLLVRDAILNNTADSFRAVLTEEDAEEHIREHMEEMIATANAVLKARGFEYEAYCYSSGYFVCWKMLADGGASDYFGARRSVLSYADGRLFKPDGLRQL